MSPIKIHTLPALPTSGQEGSATLRTQIEQALLGTEHPTVPGDTPADKAWAFKRSIPTVVLYDEAGLRLYDNITAHAPEYYLFPDELNLLKNHGKEIARAMGFPGGGDRQDHHDEREEQPESDFVEEKRWRMARWGDSEVGKWNGGVNGEEGLGSGGSWERGWDVVELGAGALRKTAYLLTALSSSLPPAPTNAASLPAPITYHPLDLSRPELHRVLGEMDEAFGQILKGKVDCIGLHGDYDAGLQFIRAGKLGSLQEQPNKSSERGRVLGLDGLSISARHDSLSSDRGVQSPISPLEVAAAAAAGVEGSSAKPIDVSPPVTAASGSSSEPLFSPGSVVDGPLSEIPSSGSSTADPEGDDAGTWSPVRSDLPSPPFDDLPSSPEAAASTRPMHLMFLGSSLGNFEREQAAPFLKSLPLKHGDTLLLGLDGRPSPGPEGTKMVEVAYNDPAGHTRLFEEHGWDVVRRELGLKDDAGVEFVGRYNEVIGRHEAYFRSKAKQAIHLPNANQDVILEDGELLNIEWSYKYSFTEALTLFQDADFRVINSWKAPNSEYRLWLLERPSVRFNSHINNNSSTAQQTDMLSQEMDMPIAVEAAQPGKIVETMKSVPKWREWQEMWKLWDHITLEMIPKEMLHQKPIDLRHICLFYLGHIPTFLDIYLTRLTKGQHTEPVQFKDIFERGIDPDVDDPTKVHDHSEVPVDEADWPSLDTILLFRDRVRARLQGIYAKLDSGEMEFSRRAGRMLFMTFEHEAMHAETLLYMLLQSPLTRAPTAVAAPQWDALAAKWDREAEPNRVLALSGGTVRMGHVDLEADDAKYPTRDGWAEHEFGWDIEHPQVDYAVQPFKIDALPISNNEYMAFLQATGADLTPKAKDALPASWVYDSGEWKARTLYGPVGFSAAGRWPLMASRNEIEAYAKWKGGRLPTEPEIRLLWENDQGPRPAGLAANVGFKNWHPVPPTLTRMDNDGKTLYGHNGGVWEWTSTPLEGHEGYVQSELYPGYSSDFFDGKHSVVLGGSFATVPQLAGRKSFRNWYQANYRFSFIGGRVAYDA